MADSDIAFAELDFDRGERFQTVRRELGVGDGQHVGRAGHARESWEEGAAGRQLQEIPLPDHLPAS